MNYPLPLCSATSYWASGDENEMKMIMDIILATILKIEFNLLLLTKSA